MRPLAQKRYKPDGDAGSSLDPVESKVEDKLALLDELKLAEMRATTSQLASVIGHVIGTSLNVIVGRASLLKTDSDPVRMAEHARRIERQALNLTGEVQRLINYLIVPEPRDLEVSPSAVLEDAAALYAPIAQIKDVGITVPSSAVSDETVSGNRALMILCALLSLAIRSVPAGERLTLGLALVADGGGVLYTIGVPKMQLLNTRLDRPDLPVHSDPVSAEQARILSVCATAARKNGGRVELHADASVGGVIISFRCPYSERRSSQSAAGN